MQHISLKSIVQLLIYINPFRSSTSAVAQNVEIRMVVLIDSWLTDEIIKVMQQISFIKQRVGKPQESIVQFWIYINHFRSSTSAVAQNVDVQMVDDVGAVAVQLRLLVPLRSQPGIGQYWLAVGYFPYIMTSQWKFPCIWIPIS